MVIQLAYHRTRVSVSFVGYLPLAAPPRISQALNCLEQPVLGIWNPSISLFGTCCWTELNPEKSEAWVLLRESRVYDRAF